VTDLAELHSAIVALGAQEFARRADFKVDRRGRGRCPIHGGHNDEQFALTVKEGRVMLAHCWNCGFGGDAIDLVGALRGRSRSDFVGKLEVVADLLNMGPIPDRAEQFEPEPERIDPLSYQNVVMALRKTCLKFKPIRDVCEYLKGRKLLSLASEFGLFALPDRTKQGEVVAELLKVFEVETLFASGLIRRDDSGRYDFRHLQWSEHRLCVPWANLSGQVEALQRRCLGSSKPKYVFPSGIAPMHPFGIAQLRTVPKDHPIAFCEGALDTIALTAICRREGYSIIALGLPGVDGWRESYSDLCRGRVVYLAFDNDAAGTKAFVDLAPRLHEAGVTEIHRWQPDCGNDWGDTLTKVAP
jgi:DNA primase